MSRLYNAKQLSILLGVSYGHVRRLLSESPESLPPWVPIGKIRRWRKETVEEWLEENETNRPMKRDELQAPKELG